MRAVAVRCLKSDRSALPRRKKEFDRNVINAISIWLESKFAGGSNNLLETSKILLETSKICWRLEEFVDDE
jgi:hypothetical protein